jgi:predicted ArsR family transcriptional regulator
MSKLTEQREENRSKLEKVISTAGKAMTLSEIAELSGIPIPTVKRHLDYLESIGRIHIENYRGFRLYRWNGYTEYSDRLEISRDHTLFIDVMINQWDQPFIRVKERKNGNDIGAIIVPGKSVEEFIRKFVSVSKNLSRYSSQNNEYQQTT